MIIHIFSFFFTILFIFRIQVSKKVPFHSLANRKGRILYFNKIEGVKYKIHISKMHHLFDVIKSGRNYAEKVNTETAE